MDRRHFITGAMALCASAGPLLAQTPEIVNQIVGQLRGQGYDKITVRRTLLGRLRLVAQGAGQRREIIVNPNTGEILRDFWSSDTNENTQKIFDTSERDPDQSTDDDSDDSDTGSGGRSGSDDDSDDHSSDDERDERDDRDDHSDDDRDEDDDDDDEDDDDDDDDDEDDDDDDDDERED